MVSGEEGKEERREKEGRVVVLVAKAKGLSRLEGGSLFVIIRIISKFLRGGSLSQGAIK